MELAASKGGAPKAFYWVVYDGFQHGFNLLSPGARAHVETQPPKQLPGAPHAEPKFKHTVSRHATVYGPKFQYRIVPSWLVLRQYDTLLAGCRFASAIPFRSFSVSLLEIGTGLDIVPPGTHMLKKHFGRYDN